MKNLKISIRTLASNSKGLGNLNRCLIISEKLRKQKFEINFIIDDDPMIISIIKKRKFHYNVIKNKLTIKNEINEIKKIITIENSDALIIDMREFGEKISKHLKNYTKTILFDDAWGKKCYADIIFNGTMIKDYTKYVKIFPKSKIFTGTKYFIADENFYKNRRKKFEKKKKRKYKVILSIGGSDPRNLTFMIMKSISKLPNISLVVILGPFMKKTTMIHNYIKNQKNIKLIESPKDIWKWFNIADVVISNAGNTLFELAIQRIPSLCIPVIEHQIPYSNYFHRKGSTVNLGKWDSITEKKIQFNIIKLLNDQNRLQKMGISGGKIIDGKGSERVVDIINKFLRK